MPRVAILFEFPSVNGGENSQLTTLRVVRDSGYEVVALAPERGPLADALKTENVPVIAWQVRDQQGQRQPQPLLRDQLHRQLGRLKPALVHANSLSMARLMGPVGVSLGAACVGHIRDIVRLSQRAIQDLNCNTRLLAVSRATRSWHIEAGLAADNTFVLYNGVDLDRFRPRESNGQLHRQLGIPTSSRLVGGIGQLGMRKGFDIWLEAAQTVARQQPDVHFLIVGERHSQKDESRQFERQLHQLAAREPLAQRVHFLGRRSDVDRILNELCVFVHAARQEPAGRVLLEAAASAVAVVATDVGGTAELLPRDRDVAWLVPPDSAAAISRAVLGLLADERLRQSLASAARRRAQRHFGAIDAGRRLVSHYEAVRQAVPGH